MAAPRKVDEETRARGAVVADPPAGIEIAVVSRACDQDRKQGRVVAHED